MKLKFETRCKALHEQDKDRAGYGGWTPYSTNAKTVEGIVRRMKEEASRALERRVMFYETCEGARKFDLYDQDHVWLFHTYAPYKDNVLHFLAYAFKRDGEYGPIEFSWCGCGEWKQYANYKATRKYIDSQCA